MEEAGTSKGMHFAVLAGEHPPSTIMLPPVLFTGQRRIRDGDLLHFALENRLHTVSFEKDDSGMRFVSPGDWERFVDESDIGDYSEALFWYVGEGLFEVRPVADIGHKPQNAWFRHHCVGPSNQPVPNYAAEGLSCTVTMTKHTTRKLGVSKVFAEAGKLKGHKYVYLPPRLSLETKVNLEFHVSGLTRFGGGWKTVYDSLNLCKGNVCTFSLLCREVSRDLENDINIVVDVDRVADAGGL